MNSICACGSNLDFDQCCGCIINGTRQAATAEQLMRSRYTAFTLANVDYLMRSHHSKSRPTRDRKQILAWAKSVKWMGLTIIRTELGQLDDSIGFVEFRAMFIEDGQLSQIHENSRFERESGKWVYHSAVTLKHE